ncbi:MAG TPA: cupin domain-containing protein [Gemmatimonadaceae bacterium]|jgi:quercetin dioxygenase-like cupin family protein|nr:cupin domain-containing protein [Gemmatimonadaceae bacterium]
MTRRTLVTASTIVAAFALGLTVDHLAFAAQQQPTIKRTILQRQDDPASSKYEAVMGISEIPPGGTSGKHRHPGIELSYVLDGSVELTHAGKPPVTIKAGEATMNTLGGIHTATNRGTTPVKILTVYIVEKGKPLAEQVP